MANPYPANFETLEGARRLTGQVDFTDPANQPGGGGSQPLQLVGPIAVRFNGAADPVSHLEKVYDLDAGTLLLDVKIVVTTAFADGTPIMEIAVGGADWASFDTWSVINERLITSADSDADSASFAPTRGTTAGHEVGSTQNGGAAFSGPGAVLVTIDPAWTAGEADLYLLLGTPTAP